MAVLVTPHLPIVPQSSSASHSSKVLAANPGSIIQRYPLGEQVGHLGPDLGAKCSRAASGEDQAKETKASKRVQLVPAQWTNCNMENL